LRLLFIHSSKRVRRAVHLSTCFQHSLFRSRATHLRFEFVDRISECLFACSRRTTFCSQHSPAPSSGIRSSFCVPSAPPPHRSPSRGLRRSDHGPLLRARLRYPLGAGCCRATPLPSGSRGCRAIDAAYVTRRRASTPPHFLAPLPRSPAPLLSRFLARRRMAGMQ
jgi:hypothetical protein